MVLSDIEYLYNELLEEVNSWVGTFEEVEGVTPHEVIKEAERVVKMGYNTIVLERQLNEYKGLLKWIKL